MKNYFATVLIILAAISCGAKQEDPKPGPDPAPETLPAPTGVMLDGVAGVDELTFKWDAVIGAKGYSYRLLEDKTIRFSNSGSSTNAKFSGLKQETTYAFEVKATADDKESAWSNRINATTGKKAPSEEYPDPIGTPDQVYAAMNMPDESGTRAFPGAQGGGMQATGGRGGKIYHVTKLTDGNEEGTLRWAVNQKGARTIVFDVAGTIALTSRLDIKNGDLTIAGQTAPGDGICIRDNNVRINTSNVIIRFVRFRMGDVKAVEDDALNCYTKSGLSNVIIDHCSMSWSTDECGSFYGVDGFTLQWCILSESLRISVHGKGTHGYGGIWGGKNASFHHNLLAHHDSRNCRFDHDYVSTEKGPVHYYNNVVYNWGANSSYGGESAKGSEPRRINMVNNYYKPGKATGSNVKTRLVNPTAKCSNCNGSDQYDVVPGKFFIEGNVMDGGSEVTADNWKGVSPDKNDSFTLDDFKASAYQGDRPEKLQTAQAAYESVLAHAGASARRDKVDTRIVKETRDGSYTYTGSKGSTGGLIDTQEDVGGWPELKATEDELKKVYDSDSDGIPNWYEALFGLNMNDPSDATLFTIDSKQRRYTNFEMYLHYLAKDTQ